MYAVLIRRVVAGGLMVRAAIVPDHDIAFAPDVMFRHPTVAETGKSRLKLPSRSAQTFRTRTPAVYRLGPDAITPHGGNLVRTHVFLLKAGLGLMFGSAR
jgi:hypothetical protein